MSIMPGGYPGLAGRTAVITGAAGGIGAATGRLLAEEGARVALLARRTERLESLAKEIDANGGQALAVTTDVRDDTSVHAAAERIHDAYGHVDLIVNAARVMLPSPIEAGRADEWARMIDTNINGVLRIIRTFGVDLFLAAAQGLPADLVSISCLCPHAGTAHYAVYNASEAAVTQLSATLRAELGPRNVRVTNIEPGLVRAEHTDSPGLSARLGSMFDSRARRLLEAADVADLIAHITSRPAHVHLRQAIIQSTRATLPATHPVARL